MPAELKPYPEYKDSGQPWLGSVPVHWQVERVRASVTKCQNGLWGSDPDGTNDVACVRVADFDRVNLRVKPRVPTRRALTEKERLGRLLQAGDLLLEKSGGGDLQPVGVVVSYDRDAGPTVCSNFVARMVAAPGFHSRFLVYLHSALYAYGINRQSIKQTTGIQNLDGYSYLCERVAFPPPAEQAGIVRFLGAVDRKVNRFIRAKRRLIEVLTEQKQAIITHAVTRGLNPHAPLKPSGIDWLGDVPEHWEVLRLRNLVSQVTSGSRGWSRYMADTGPLFIRIGNLTRGSLELDMSDAARLQLPKDASEVHRTRAQANDILVSITAYIGSFAVVPEGIEEAYVSQHVALCRPRPTVHNARWVGYVLLSPIGQAHGKFSLNGGTKDGLSLDDVKNHPLLMPPPGEQDRIVAWIESESAQLNASIAAIKREIDLIREYRTRLVADVVTGKVDVRAAAASLPDEPPTAAGGGWGDDFAPAEDDGTPGWDDPGADGADGDDPADHAHPSPPPEEVEA